MMDLGLLLMVAVGIVLLPVIAIVLLIVLCLAGRLGGVVRVLMRGAGMVLVLLLIVGTVLLVARNLSSGYAEAPLEASDYRSAQEESAPADGAGQGRRGSSLDSDSIPLADPAVARGSEPEQRENGKYSVVYIDYERRPEWVESTPVVDTRGTDRIAVSSGPWVLRRESVRALDEEIKLAADQYIRQYVGNDAATALLRYDTSALKRRLIGTGRMHEEVIEVSVGPMHQVHALLEFDPEFRAEIDARWNKIVATSRLMQTGLGALAVLGLLGVAFGYLRLDTATRGYYTRRLRFATLAAILTLIVAGTLLASWIPWI